MNKLFLIILFWLFLSSTLSAQFYISGGTNIGGAVPMEKTEGSTAVIYPGAFLSFGNTIRISDRLSFTPQINFDLRRFDYFATQKKDTIVETVVLGNIANVPTYYQANIHGQIRLLGINAELPFAYRIGKKLEFAFGIYGTAYPFKSDEITINVKIGEGGLLPDIDSTYNNKEKINNFDAGLMIGGSFQANERLSFFITAHRSLTRFYKMNAVKNDAGNDIPFYYTQARIGIRYSFIKGNNPKNNLP